MHRSSGRCPWSTGAWFTSVRTMLLVLLGSSVLFSSPAAWGASGPAVVALGVVGSAAPVIAACLALRAVLVQVLVIGLPSGCVQRARSASSRVIPRAQEPGRPGRPQPRAPGAALLPHPAR